MGSQAINLESGLVLKQQQQPSPVPPSVPTQGAIDLTAGLRPGATSAPAGPKMAAGPAIPNADVDVSNPSGEGTYSFERPDGKVVKVPYSQALEILGHPEGAIGSGHAEVDRLRSGVEAALAKGYAISNEDITRLYHDYSYDPRFKDQKRQNFLNSIPALQHAIGFFRGGAKTVSGADEIVSKATGRDNNLSSLVTGPQRTKVERAISDFAHEPNANVFQHTGEMSEDITEFVGGEALLSAIGKVVKGGATLGEAARIEQEMRKGSTVGKLLKVALKQGTVGGVQSGVKSGGDVKAATRDAAIVGGTSLVLGGAAEGTSKLLNKIRPGTTTIAGETMPKLASQEENASKLARKVAPIESAPEVAKAQQEGSQRAIKNIASESATKSITKAEVPAYRVREVGEKGIPVRNGHAQATVSKAEAEKYLPGREALYGGKGQEVVRVDLSKLKAGQDYTLRQGPNGSQWVKFNREIPESAIMTKEPAPIRVNSFQEAADKIKDQARPIFNKLNEETNGLFKSLQDERSAAFRRGDLEGVKNVDAQLESFFDPKVKSSIKNTTPEELTKARAAWREAKTMEEIHSAIEGPGNRTPEDIMQRTGTQRVIKGEQLQNRLDKLLADRRKEVEQVIGKDGVDNLYRISKLTRKSPEATKEVLDNVTRYYRHRYGAGAVIGGTAGYAVGGPVGGGVGAVAGAATEDATRRLLHAAAVNPRVGRMIENAVKVNANPRVYAPLIAATLRTMEEDNQQ